MNGAMRARVYSAFSETPWLYIGFAIYAIGFCFLFFLLIKKQSRFRAVAVLFIQFLVALLPVINLYFQYNKDIEQDRYLYIASAFFYSAFCVCLYLLAKKYYRWITMVVIALWSYFLLQYNNCWQKSGALAHSLLQNFDQQDAQRLCVLLTPDDVGGAYCMRSMPGSTLAQMLLAQRNLDTKNKIMEAYQYNSYTGNDSAFVVETGNYTLRVGLVSPGAWLWKNSFGASDFSNDWFSCKKREGNAAFDISFKEWRSGDIIIYPVRGKWETYRFM